MNIKFPKLFETGEIGKLELKNRIIKAPTLTHLGARDGSVTEKLIRHYQEITRGGSALVIVEGAFIDDIASKIGSGQLGVSHDRYLPGLRQLAEAIHIDGAKAELQIAHCGVQRRLGNYPIKAPSSIISSASHIRSKVLPEELTASEIKEIINNFGDAARRAKMAGFDMVEIHGAHGYLITEFLSPRTNIRTDNYGGSPQKRMGFLLEIVTDAREKVGLDFPISVRLSGTEYEPDGIMIEDTIAVAIELEKHGANSVHISGGGKNQRLPRQATMAMPLGSMVEEAVAVKRAVNIPIIASGSILTPEFAEEVLKTGKADFVALARPLLADPYWPKKALEGRPEDIRPCIRCNDGCFYRLTGRYRPFMCTVNATLAKEATLIINLAEIKRKVAIIGGGPAGLEAARVCALRGHDVTIFEKRQLGGALIEASIPEFKPDLRRLCEYYLSQVKQLRIKVVNEEATVNTIKKGSFNAVIVAVGGTPIKLDVPGSDKPNVVGALEVLSRKAPVGQRVVMVGGGLVGSETGLFLAEQGKEVIFVEVLDEFMNGVGFLDQIVYRERLGRHKVTVHTGKRVETVLDQGAVIIDKYGKREEILADSIVAAIGFAPQTALAEEFKRAGFKVYVAGDCVRPRKIFEAIHEGFSVAYSIR